MNSGANETNAVWSAHRSWFLVRPPSRPATWQLHVIRSWLAALRLEGEVAILGSTPEFQDLISEFEGLRPVLIDRCAEFSGHVRHQRRRRDRHGASPELIVGDWTEVLEQCQSRFVAVLSDLTSGNIPYVERNRHYAAVAASLRTGGLFADRVLTRESPLRSRRAVYEKFEGRSIGIESLNELNCELLFTSDLHSGDELRIEPMLAAARREWTTESGQAFLDGLELITPSGGTWWYGRPWEDLASTHGAELLLGTEYPEPCGSPYFGHARLVMKRRDVLAAPQGITEGALRAGRSRAISVLEEAKALLDAMPLPDAKLGEDFLHWIVERAVSFRDACLQFGMESLEIDARHWRFMDSLFQSIQNQPVPRDRTYSFVWRHRSTDVLFSKDWPEWKSLFAKAIELAAAGQIQVRALMVADDPYAERMGALTELAAAIGGEFQIRIIPTVDFDATKNSDGLAQYLDFGVFGSAAAFLTKHYEPAVVGQYVWAAERVIGIHDLFDRIWDQASRLSCGARPRQSNQDHHEALAELVRKDKALPVSCVARVVEHGGAALELNRSDRERVYSLSAQLHSAMETELRDRVRQALCREFGDEGAAGEVHKFLEARYAPKGVGLQRRREKAIENRDLVRLLASMYFKDLCDLVENFWGKVKPPGDRGEIRQAMLTANRRPHAHADQEFDIADFVHYRNAIRQLQHWLEEWKHRLKQAAPQEGSK